MEAEKSDETTMGTQKISVLDHVNGLQYTTEKSDSFLIDMESFSNGGNKDLNNANSRMKKSFSRKVSQRGIEKKINSKGTANDDRDAIVALSSPRASLVGHSMPERATVVAAGTTDQSSNPQLHHQITITTGNISATTEGRGTFRRNSFKRSQTSWTIDPKRVLFFFATLSSIGTLLLIYFTLSISKLNADDALD